MSAPSLLCPHHVSAPRHMCLCSPPDSGLLIAMLLSLLFLLLLRFTAPVLVWVLIVGVLAADAYGGSRLVIGGSRSCAVSTHWSCGCIADVPHGYPALTGIWHCYWEYNNYKNSNTTINTLGFTTNFSAYLQVKETWLAFSKSAWPCGS